MTAEERIEYNRKYYRENAEKQKAAVRKWDATNPEKKKARNRKWAQANPESEKVRNTRWVQENPEKAKAHNSQRRARVKGAAINDFTAIEWLDILEEFYYQCAYCNKVDCALEQDHIVPLARGGNHTKNNIVPACGSCNKRKAKKLLWEWIQQ